MDNFNLKEWLIENKVGNFGKALIKENIQNEADETVFNASDFPVTETNTTVVSENKEGIVDTKIDEWEVTILGKDHLIDADVEVSFYYESPSYDDLGRDYGGYYADGARAVITKLGIEDGDTYRDVTDPAYIKQIQDLINTDPKLNAKLLDASEDNVDWGSLGEPYDDMSEANEQIGVGYVMKTKPSDPKY
jgi:hypothetical protein